MTEIPLTFKHGCTDVRIGAGCIGELGRLIADRLAPPTVLVVTDQTVASLYARSVVSVLAEEDLVADLAVIPVGEGSKSLRMAEELYGRLAAARLGRDGALVAVGGGMVSDLTGFVAATWMRGVPFVVCPTTLESDIDASIGGKTAVNHAGGKNLIGAFHQPRLVVIDPECLRTLPERDVIAGLGESVKHAVIRDPDFLGWHRQNGLAILGGKTETLTELIERNVRIKAAVVQADECERSGERAILNFGHTLGHAIESWAGYELRHGECVGLGMVAASRMSVEMGLLPDEKQAEIVETLRALRLPTRLRSVPPIEVLLEYIGRDKKAAGRRVRWVLLEGLGRPVLRNDVSDSVVRTGIQAVLPG